MTAPAKVTKKQLKAEAVAERKLSAYRAKVRRLIQFYAGLEKSKEITDAFNSGIPAETFAASIAAKEPVGRVVHPLKIEAIKRARQHAEEKVAYIRKQLEEAGWDVNKVAPYPGDEVHGLMWQVKYHHYQFVSGITRWRNGARSHADRSPLLVDMNPEGIERFIANTEENTAWEYDLFIIKLVDKVGLVTKAELEGDHVWHESILTVTKKDKTIERWKTKEITNVSKLGLYFPQWPTRLMKD